MHATLVIAGMVLCTQVLHAALIIDAFDSPAGGQTVSLVNQPAGASDSNTRTANVLGGTRTLFLEIQEEIKPGFTASAYANSPSGFFCSDVDAAYDVVVRVSYDAGGVGLALNASGFTGVLISTTIQDGSPCLYGVTVETTGRGLSVAYNLKGPSFVGDVFFPKSTFSVSSGEGVSWSQVDRIVLMVDSTTPGGDVQIDALTLVPEPSGTPLLWSLGVCAILNRRIILWINCAHDKRPERRGNAKEV